MRSRIVRVGLMLLVAIAAVAPLSAQTGPGQPLFGPGGRIYPHATVFSRGPFWPAGFEGNDNYRYFIFEPATPAPAVAPVVLFLHAWQANNPIEYAFLISHIVRKGHIVVWVQYQSGIVATWNYARHAEVAWLDALGRLQTDPAGRVRPERDSTGQMKTAFVGHSAGGLLSAIIAAKAGRSWPAMPLPAAVVAFVPGRLGLIPTFEDFANIDPQTKLVMVVGDIDNVVCTGTATFIWDHTPQIPDENKDYLMVVTDTRGTPAQLGNHYFPTNTGVFDTAPLDARDFYITYKLSVGALNCAFRGTDCDYAIGNGSALQTDMGRWSDGVQIKPLAWVSDPSTLPVCPQ